MNGRERITLRAFAGFVRGNRENRLEIARKGKTQCQTAYVPYLDPYRALRAAIIRMHTDGRGPDMLDAAVATAATERARTVLREAADGYMLWLNGRSPIPFPVAAGDWRFAEAQVRANPEIGLVIDGVPYLIKLHFNKGESVGSRDAAVMTRVMRRALGEGLAPETRMAVLDIRTGILHVENPGAAAATDATIERAASDLAVIWEQVA